ncbi:MAG: hypothetical protein ACOX4W_05160 [Bacilli bacterium]|jgi:hypothetical protein
MEYTNAIDEKIFEVLVTVGVVEESTAIEDCEATIAMVKEYLNNAKITEAQAVAIASAIVENAELMEYITNSSATMTTDDFKAFLELYEVLLGLIGNDALGKLGYQLLAEQYEGTDRPEPGLIIGVGLGYENFVLTSRLLLTIIGNFCAGIGDDDIEFIASVAVNGEAPTNTEIVYLAKIAANAIDNINLDDSVWGQYFAAITGKFADIIASIEEAEAADTTDPEDPEADVYYYGEAIQSLQLTEAVLGAIDEYINLDLELVSALLRKLNVNYLKVMSANIYSESSWDHILEEVTHTYYIDDVEVTEEEYKKANLKQPFESIKLALAAYKSLDTDAQAQLLVEIQTAIAALNATLEANAIEPIEYEGETSTFADLMAIIEEIAATNINTTSVDELETLEEELEIVSQQYILGTAPYLTLLISPK